MQEKEFAIYLKKTGRPEHTINRYLRTMRDFESYLKDVHSRSQIGESTAEDLRAYAEHLKETNPRRAYQIMWPIGVYFDFMGIESLSKLADALKWHIHDRPLKLNDINGIEKDCIRKLAKAGIRDVRQMIEQASTPSARNALSARTNVSAEVILELTKISDLSRIGGLKAIRARLYHDAGLDTLDKISKQNPAKMKDYLEKWIKENNFPGASPTLGEATWSVSSASFLDRMVKY